MDKTAFNTAIHLFLTGKGGIGKSHSAGVLTEWLQEVVPAVYGYDTDTENKTTSSFSALGYLPVNILDGDSRIDERLFDAMMSQILETDGAHIVDNGANSYRPLVGYIVDNQLFQMIADTGRPLYVHVVISGGPDLMDTTTGFVQLADLVRANGSSARFVIWLNSYHGALEHEGVEVMDAPQVKKNKDLVAGVVYLNQAISKLHVQDVVKKNVARQTFKEYWEGGGKDIMTRSRVKAVRKGLFEQLAAVGW